MIKPGRAPDYRDRDYAKKGNTAVRPTKSELEQCEIQINNALNFIQNGFRIVTSSVARVKNEKLWQQGGWSSFDDWCVKNRGWSAKRGYQLAETEATLALLAPENSTIVENEAQARALKAVEPERRDEVIKEVKATGKVTAKRITETTRRRMPIVIDVEAEPEKITARNPCPACGGTGFAE